MSDFLLELLSEEIPARMQAKACADLRWAFETEIRVEASLHEGRVRTYSTPRRLVLIAEGLENQTEAEAEEIKGPRAGATEQAIEGFLRKNGASRDQLDPRPDEKGAVTFYLSRQKPSRPTKDVLATIIPRIVTSFPWPKSMRWGAASVSTESPRWVRPLQGIVALLGEEIVDFEIAGIRSGAATVGHRFHHPGIITIGGAHDYAEKLRACHVIVDPEERKAIIRDGAAAVAAAAGLALVEDEGLVAENAGLTEWPVPLLGAFDPAFLEVPREVIQLTMRTNQKYFACLVPPRDGEGDHAEHGGGGAEARTIPPPPSGSAGRSPSPYRGGSLAPAFVCTANIEASDGGLGVVAGNERVLSARLADAKFFWEQDVKVPLAEQAKKLGDIVFHEKLGTVADKVERVAKLARWLVEEGIVTSSPERGGGPAKPVEGAPRPSERMDTPLHHQPAAGGSPPRSGEDQERLADLAETAARLCKADLVTGLVGEFPELQGAIGGHLARAQGLDPQIADAIRDHYKPVGQGDDVPTAPVTVAVSLADKLDTLAGFFDQNMEPSGSRDPFALRRAAIAVLTLITTHHVRLSLLQVLDRSKDNAIEASHAADKQRQDRTSGIFMGSPRLGVTRKRVGFEEPQDKLVWELFDFFADRLKVQQREAGVRHDLIDAVFALGGEDDLVRLLARVKALQAFVETGEGADLLAGYKRAANILKKEGYVAPAKAGASGREDAGASPAEMPASAGMTGKKQLSYTPEKAEADLIAALDAAAPKAQAAVSAEDFEGAMAALASLRAPVDTFFDRVTVNDPDPARREARLNLLARMRDAVHQVADFSKIEG